MFSDNSRLGIEAEMKRGKDKIVGIRIKKSPSTYIKSRL